MNASQLIQMLENISLNTVEMRELNRQSFQILEDMSIQQLTVQTVQMTRLDLKILDL